MLIDFDLERFTNRHLVEVDIENFSDLSVKVFAKVFFAFRFVYFKILNGDSSIHFSVIIYLLNGVLFHTCFILTYYTNKCNEFPKLV